MSSPQGSNLSPQIRYPQKVQEFRSRLTPAELERLNEIFMKICRDPRSDSIHKFPFSSPPLVGKIYHDDDFVVVYQYSRFSTKASTWVYQIDVVLVKYTTDATQLLSGKTTKKK